jgi:hypothetical protein
MPEFGADQRMGLRHPDVLTLAPGDVRDDVLDRPLSLDPGLNIHASRISASRASHSIRAVRIGPSSWLLSMSPFMITALR